MEDITDVIIWMDGRCEENLTEDLKRLYTISIEFTCDICTATEKKDI